MTRSRRLFLLALLVGACAGGPVAPALAAASPSPQAAPMLRGPLRTYPPHPLAAEANRGRPNASATTATPARRRAVTTAETAGATTALSQPILSADGSLLIVPFQGPAPRFKLYTLSPSHHYIDFSDAELDGPWVQRAGGTGPLTRLDCVVHPEQRFTRLAFEANTPLTVQTHVLTLAHRVVIRLTPLASPSPAAPTAARPSKRENAPSTPASAAPLAKLSATPAPASSARPAAASASPSPAPVAQASTAPAAAIARAAGTSSVSQAAAAPAPVAAATPHATATPAPAATVSPSAQPPVAQASAMPAADKAAAAPSDKATPSPAPAPAWRTRLTGIAYDPVRQALAVPYDGDLPAPETHTVTPQQLTLRFRDTAWAEALRAQVRDGAAESAIKHYALRSDADGSATLSLELRRPGEMLVAYAPNQRRLYLVPQLTPEKPAALPESGSVRSVLGRFSFDPKLRALVAPYFGQAPSALLETVTPTQCYVEFADCAFDPKGVQLETVADFPLLDHYWVSPRTDRVAVRLALHLPYGGHARVVDDAANHRLVITPQLGPAPSGN